MSRIGRSQSPEVMAAYMAAGFAQRIGLSAGNMWEPGIARNIVSRFAECEDWEMVREEYTLRLFGVSS